MIDNKNNNLLVSIDIGTTKVAVLVGEENSFGKIKILAHSNLPSKGVKNGKIQNIGLITSTVRKALSMAEQSLGYEIKNVTIETGVAGEYIHCFSDNTEILRSNPESLIIKPELDSLRERVRTSTPLRAGETILDVLDQSFLVDKKLVTDTPIGMKGKRLSGIFRIISGSTAEISQFRNSVNYIEKGITSNTPIVQPIASASAVLTKREKEGGVILIDIGGGTTDIAIFLDGILRHTVMISLGGAYITEKISELCKCSFQEAETLKVQFGKLVDAINDENEIISIQPIIEGGTPLEISRKSLTSIIRECMKDIFAQVSLQIQSYKEEIGNDFPNRIILTGGGSLLKDIQSLTEYMLSAEVRLGTPNLHLEEGNKNNEISSPIYSTAIGLLVHILERRNKAREEQKNSEICSSIDIDPQGIPNRLFEQKTENTTLDQESSSGSEEQTQDHKEEIKVEQTQEKPSFTDKVTDWFKGLFSE